MPRIIFSLLIIIKENVFYFEPYRLTLKSGRIPEQKTYQIGGCKIQCKCARLPVVFGPFFLLTRNYRPLLLRVLFFDFIIQTFHSVTTNFEYFTEKITTIYFN